MIRTKGMADQLNGIVIFIAADAAKALVWCSDHGPLAVLYQAAYPRDGGPPLAIGDLLRFSVDQIGPLRICHDVAREQPRAAPALAAMMQGIASLDGEGLAPET